MLQLPLPAAPLHLPKTYPVRARRLILRLTPERLSLPMARVELAIGCGLTPLLLLAPVIPLAQVGLLLPLKRFQAKAQRLFLRLSLAETPRP
jgi:hypothetical protein